MKKFRNNAGRAKWTKTFLILCVLFSAASAISHYSQLRLIQSWMAGDEVYILDAEVNDTIQGIVGISGLICLLVMLGFFIAWFRRGYFNLHQKVNHLNHSEGWAAGAWFVPFLNLYRPYQIMKEMVEESSFYLKTKGIKVRSDFGGLVLTWWILNILTNFIGRILWKMPDETLEQLEEYTQFAIGGSLIDIVFYGISFKLVANYSAREELMLDAENNEINPPENPESQLPEPDLALT